MHMQCSECRCGHGGKGDENLEKEQPVAALFGSTCSIAFDDFQAKFIDKHLFFVSIHHQSSISVIRYFI